MESGERKWSIVMTGFAGEWGDLVDATREAFGREGFDASGAAVYPDRYLPAEIADSLTQSDAEMAAKRLEQAGATMVAVRTSELPPVRYRARDYWSQTYVGDHCFTEIDGMITDLNPTRARDLLYDHLEGVPSWQSEGFMNHGHTGGASLEAAVAEGREMVAETESDLRQAYPDRAFTISHWLGDEVTFWQTAPDSPREPEPNQELTFIEPSVPEAKQE